MKVEFLVSIKHPDDAEPMFMTREQAKQVYDALHAEFGDFGQAREISQLARESVAREVRLAELEYEVMRLEMMSTYRLVKPECGPECVNPPKIEVTLGETGPSLQDDIEAMIADHIVDANEKVDEPIFDEAKFLAGSPQPVLPEPTPTCCDGWPLCDCDDPKPIKHPSNMPEPPAEPETAPETPAPSNDQQMTLGDVREAWSGILQDYPDFKEWEHVNRFCIRHKLPAAKGRAMLAQAGIELKPPRGKATSAPEPERSAFVDRFPAPPKGLTALDAMALAFEILEHDAPTISSFYVSQAGMDAVMAFKRQLSELRAEYQALPGFKRTEFKTQLSEKWRSGKVAA